MKKCSLAILVTITAMLVITGCGSIPGSSLISAGQSIQAVAQVAEKTDFKSGEVLCSEGTENDVTDMWYGAAKVITPASPATKNQAEVIFVGNGKKAWSSFVIPSHKATDAELTVGRLVFVLHGYTDRDAKDVSVDTYRQQGWALGRITSTDELFKKRVEVGGDKYHPDLIRIPDIPLE